MQRDFNLQIQFLFEMEQEKNALQDSLKELETTSKQDFEKCKQEMEEEKARLIRKYEQGTNSFQLHKLTRTHFKRRSTE